MTTSQASQISAVNYACKITRRWLKDGEIFIPILHEEITSIENLFKPIIVQNEPDDVGFTVSPRTVGYEVDEADMPKLEKALSNNKQAARIISDKLMQHIISDQPMAWQLKGLLMTILRGGIVIPKSKGGRKSVSDRTVLFCGLVDQIKGRFGVTASCSKAALSAKKTPPVDTGVSIVSAVFRAVGLHFEANTAFGVYDKGTSSREIANANPIIFHKINEMSSIQDRLNVLSSEMNSDDMKSFNKACADLGLPLNNLP